MNPRSWLFVPGDSEKKLSGASAAGADALILDLEDAVAAPRKADARQMTRRYLEEYSVSKRTSALWVRINPLGESALADLAAVVGGRPDGIVLPKIDGPADVLKISHYLDALEEREGIEVERTKILPVATETPLAPFSLAGFAQSRLGRLAGLTWRAEDLSAALGASTNLDEAGRWTFTYRYARTLCLMAAKAANVQAIETLYVDYRDSAGLAASCRAAAREGFTGRIAIHPSQVGPINEAFSPSNEEVLQARRIVEAFESKSEGTIGLDGKMLDLPHLRQARQVIERHEAYAKDMQVAG
jgi:citrate lyase subunit beta/citryl-CoA lyase